MGTVGASTAAAALAPGYGSIGTFPMTFGFAGPGHAAVDDATGNVLVTDFVNSTVQVLAPDLNPGGTVTPLTQFTAVAPFAVAVDQSTHAVYVSEGSPANRLERFVSDGAPVPTYTLDLTFMGPALNNAASDALSPVAVDPTTHDVLVGDGDRVNRYTSTGVLVRSIDGADSTGGKFHHVYDVAVGATKTYVVDYKGPPGTPSGGDGVTRIVQFDAQDAFDRTLEATDTPTAVTVDPGLDRPVSAGRMGTGQGGSQLSVFADGVVGGVSNLAAPGAYITGLAVDGGASDRVYAVISDPGGVDTGVHVFVPGPGSRADALSSTDAHAAHLTGSINPEGKATTARFQYCAEIDPCGAYTGPNPGDPANPWHWAPDLADPAIDVGAGSVDVPMATDVTSLRPRTKYSVQISATDTQVTDLSPVAIVATAAAPPLATTGLVSDLSSTAATVTGTVTPLGTQTTYYFEYGESTAYGSRVPLADGAGVAGNGYTARTVSRGISGLKPGTLYHYRLVGVNAAGTTPGADRTFTTDAGGQLLRAYEMVSPVDKQAVPVDTGFGGVRASDDGDNLLYGTQKSSLPGGEATTFVPRALSARSTVAWTGGPLDLPLDNLTPQNDLFYGALSVSSDVRRALVLSRKKLSDGAVEGGWNLYIREPAASDPAQEFKLVASDPMLAALAGQTGAFHMVGTSDDLHTTAFTDGVHMYEAILGEGIRLVSRMPDGSAATLPTNDPGNLLTDPHQISTDGSQIYFNIGAGDSPLYLRQNGTTTIPISVSQRPGASPAPVIAPFLGASADGRYVEFVTLGTQDGLTPSAPDDFNNAYLYDVETGVLTFLASSVSSNFSNVPRPALGALFYQATGGGLYYAHNGAVTKVADLNGLATIVRASDNGRFAAFINSARLTSYDNGGLDEVYLYDVQTGELSCASCRPDGGPTVGDVQMGTDNLNNSILARYKPRAILDDGTVYFDTADPLVGADVNGTRDVYSYRSGDVPTLISRGTLPTSSQFAEVTPDGSNVFFVTDDQLVGQDQDTTADMYDARAGGGLPGQSPKPGPAPCAGSECREAGGGPVLSDPEPSGRVNRIPAKPALVAKAKISVRSASFTATTLRLVVQVTGRGRIRASGARVQSTSRTASKAGRYALNIPLSRATRAARKAHRKLTVTVKVTLSPPFASATTAKFSRTLGK